jgi:hypothetical protein
MSSEKHQQRLVWYQRFRKLIQFLQKEPTIPEIMFKVYELMDTNRAFGSQQIACSAHRSLIQVLSDHGYGVG